MGEHKIKKQRQCEKCGKQMNVTAAELAEHAAKCKGRKREGE